MPPVRSLVTGHGIVQHDDDADLRPLGRQRPMKEEMFSSLT